MIKDINDNILQHPDLKHYLKFLENLQHFDNEKYMQKKATDFRDITDHAGVFRVHYDKNIKEYNIEFNHSVGYKYNTTQILLDNITFTHKELYKPQQFRVSKISCQNEELVSTEIRIMNNYPVATDRKQDFMELTFYNHIEKNDTFIKVNNRFSLEVELENNKFNWFFLEGYRKNFEITKLQDALEILHKNNDAETLQKIMKFFSDTKTIFTPEETELLKLKHDLYDFNINDFKSLSINLNNQQKTQKNNIKI